MNFEKLKDIYKYSKTCDITFSRDSLFELIENIESIVRNAQIESEINEAYYQENQKYKARWENLKNWIESLPINEDNFDIIPECIYNEYGKVGITKKAILDKIIELEEEK